ncbi:MAG TPA: aldehyde dehydrogenase family protein [Verrucomicrobiae bacterium]|nr:aldehyde dehydrogenase family protein [Verrucomicrobiae bacterium]
MKVLKNYINGKWLDSPSGKKKTNTNPADKRETVSEAPVSTVQDAEQAIQSANNAYAGWSHTPMPQRATLLREVVRRMEEQEDAFVNIITLENGKTLRESQTEFRAAIKEAEFQIAQGRQLGGVHLSSERPGASCYLTRRPLGVASLITPWNFPLNVACRKMFPALVAGNCCVLKPADPTPATAALLFEVMAQLDFPPGVVNFIMGQGSVIGDTLVTHPFVKAISFTGSTEVGLGIARRAAGSPTQVQLEMGGKNPLVVLADADLEKAIDAALLGAFSCSGQWCTSTSRVIVEAKIYDHFLDGLIARTREIVVGDGRDSSSRMGPVTGSKQYETILNYIQIGKNEGARLCVGGQALKEGKLAHGCFIAPTIFADVTPKMRIAQEEIFGPVLSVLKASDFDDALRIANETIYGLSSSIFTNDLAKAQRFIEDSEVGLCHVNLPTAHKEPQLEFGGVKESARGLPEAGRAGIEFFTTHKAVYVKHQL